MTTLLDAYLRTLREEAGQTLREVESQTGVSNGYLSLLEHGKVQQPSPKALYALARHYGVQYLELMRLAGYPVPDTPPEADESKIVFRGAERLTDAERQEIQELITFKLRRRKGER